MKKLGITLTATACTLTLAGCSLLGLNRTVPVSAPSSDDASASPSASVSPSARPSSKATSSPDPNNPFADNSSLQTATSSPSSASQQTPNQQSPSPVETKASASASASPTIPPENAQTIAGSTAPEPPASITAMNKEAAQEFINYWIQLHNYAMQTGDIEALEKYTDTELIGQNFITKMMAIQVAADQQGKIEGCTYELGALEEIPSFSEAVYGVTGQLLEHSCVVTGRLNYGYPETSNRMGIAVGYNGSHWQMVYLVRASQLERAFASADSDYVQS